MKRRTMEIVILWIVSVICFGVIVILIWKLFGINLPGWREREREAGMLSSLMVAAIGVELYQEAKIAYPNRLDEIMIFRDGGTRLGVYGEDILYDPWGRIIQYSLDDYGFSLKSMGGDGVEGTSDDLSVKYPRRILDGSRSPFDVLSGVWQRGGVEFQIR